MSRQFKFKEIKSITQFIEYVEKDTIKWKFGNISKPWFRGQNDSSKPPLPSVLRRNGYDEFHMVTSFRNRAHPYGKTPETGRLDQWLILMQHYGLPTRLLDWTESSLIGLFFALCDYEIDADSNTCKAPAVWMINPIELNNLTMPEFNDFPNTWTEGTALSNFKIAFGTVGDDGIAPSKYPMAFYPTHLDSRMSQQKSVFTIHGTDKRDFESMLIDTDFYKSSFIIKYIIFPTAVEKILKDLNHMGITYSSVYPDFEGLSSELKFRYSPLFSD